MRRFLGIALWLIACCVCLAPAVAFWQSRDSNYNISVSGAAPSFTGPGDVVTGAKIWWGLRAYSLASAGTKIANICNAADASCADINSLANGKFDVTTAQGAPLNCGGTGGTCTVKILYDQTGNNLCTGPVPCDASQATIANRPVLVFSCVGGTNVCMSFNGTSQALNGSNLISSLAQPVTYSSAANSTNNASQQSILSGGGSAQLGYNNAGANTVFAYGGAVLSVTASDGSWHALQAVLNNASSDMNVDGVAGSGTAGSGSAISIINIGTSSGGQWLKGTATEFGVWASAFSGAQSSAMSGNQHSFWGF